MSGANAKSNYATLREKFEDDSKNNISANLDWLRLDDKKISMVKLSKSFNFLDIDSREEQFAWFVEYVQKFIKYFQPKIKTLP